MENINRSSSFHRITSTCRAIRVVINKSHSYAELFQDCQKTMKVHTAIEADVRTRFDSTLSMLASVFKNRSVLQRMQEIGKRNSSLWPKSFHLSLEDFTNIEHVVMILSPIQEVTRSLSNASAWIGEVVPLLTSAIDVIDEMDVAYVAMNLKSALICAVYERLQMVLGTKQLIIFSSDRKLSSEIPNEHVVLLTQTQGLALRSTLATAMIID